MGLDIPISLCEYKYQGDQTGWFQRSDPDQLNFRVSSTACAADVRPPTANANTQAPCTLVEQARRPESIRGPVPERDPALFNSGL